MWCNTTDCEELVLIYEYLKLVSQSDDGGMTFSLQETPSVYSHSSTTSKSVNAKTGKPAPAGRPQTHYSNKLPCPTIVAP